MPSPNDLQSQNAAIQWTNGRGLVTGAAITAMFATVGGIFGTMGTWTGGVYSPSIPSGYISYLMTNGFGSPSVYDFGAKCSGGPDDAASIPLMAAAKGFVFVPAQCAGLRIATATTINVPLRVDPGGTIIAGGGTLAINGPLQAGDYQIFSGFSPGQVTFPTVSGKPPAVVEVPILWWGAAGNGLSGTPTADDVPVNSALASLTTGGQYVHTRGRWYYMSACGASLGIGGVGFVGNVQGGDGLVCGSSSATLLSLAGASTSARLNYNFVRNVSFYRSATPTSTAIGINALHDVNLELTNVESDNSAVPFNFADVNGNVFHTIATFSSGAFQRIGYHIDETQWTSPSLRIFGGSNALNQGGGIGNDLGYYAHGAYLQDLFANDIESAGVAVGFKMDCTQGDCIDIHLTNMIHDSYSLAGVQITGVGTFGANGPSIAINGLWTNPLATGVTSYGVQLTNISGVHMTGWSGFAGPNYAHHVQAALVNSSYNTFSNSYLEGGQYQAVLANSNFNSFSNIGFTAPFSGQSVTNAVLMNTNSSNNTFTGGFVNGYASSFTNWLSITSGSNNNEFSAIQINTGAAGGKSDAGTGNVYWPTTMP